MNNVITVSKEYRLITLNPLCPACIEIIEWRKRNPHYAISNPNQLLLRVTQQDLLVRHIRHLEFQWTSKWGSTIVK
jgi:hypothetical protein